MFNAAGIRLAAGDLCENTQFNSLIDNGVPEMRTIPPAAALTLALLGVASAQDAVFFKSALVGASGAKVTPVELTVSNNGVTIRSKDKTPSVILDLPYSSITNLGYTFGKQGRAWLLPVMGVSALFLKGESHWLVIDSNAEGVKGPTVLRLNKTEYLDVVATLTARSGKRVEMLAPGSTLLDPTAGSHDEDRVIPFPIDQVRAALKPAMEDCYCKVSSSKPGRLECARGLRPPDSIGGSEQVTAILEPQGQQTQVLIRTAKGLGRNWSSPIYLETLRRLQTH
jgi:hypothetical protein